MSYYMTSVRRVSLYPDFKHAEQAKILPQMLEASLGTGHPVARIPRGIVAHMLLMATLKLCDPVKALI